MNRAKDSKKTAAAVSGRRVCRGILCAALCLVMALGWAPDAAAETPAPIKVGFFAFEGYHMKDEKGVRSGYGYDILQHLAGYGGFKYEYIGYDNSWNEMQDMLEAGEIDILTSAQKTEERMERFDFSDTNIGVSAAILTVKAGNERYLSEDYPNWSGIRVGMLPGNSRNDSLADFAAEHGFHYEPVFFDSTEALVAALAEGDGIDAILTSNLRRTEGETVVAQFASSPFYIMVRKGNTQLLSRINSAIAQMDNCEPGLRTMLMNQYYASGEYSGLILSVEERKFISNMRSVTFTALINPDRAPTPIMKTASSPASYMRPCRRSLPAAG